MDARRKRPLTALSDSPKHHDSSPRFSTDLFIIYFIYYLSVESAER